MPYRCDFYSDEEYEYACQMEEEAYREQLAKEEAFAQYCEEEYRKELEGEHLMKNVLICYPKPSVKKIYEKVLKENPQMFQDKYSWVRTDFVFHVDDSVLLINKDDDTYSRLKLKNVVFPENTYLVHPIRETIDASNYDTVISINDPDTCGVLEFAKFLEENNIPFEKAYFCWNNDLTPQTVLFSLSAPLLSFPELYADKIKEIEEADFTCPREHQKMSR